MYLQATPFKRSLEGKKELIRMIICEHFGKGDEKGKLALMSLLYNSILDHRQLVTNYKFLGDDWYSWVMGNYLKKFGPWKQITLTILR